MIRLIAKLQDYIFRKSGIQYWISTSHKTDALNLDSFVETVDVEHEIPAAPPYPSYQFLKESTTMSSQEFVFVLWGVMSSNTSKPMSSPFNLQGQNFEEQHWT